MTDKDTMLNAALYYADLGYSVFPCKSNGKRPITTNGFKDATTDREQIEKWWTKHPYANIGMPTEGMIVVDVDGRDNPYPGDDDMGGAVLSYTPRGGRHYIYKMPEGKAWRNTASKLAKDVDTRGGGGYIVLPPSRMNGVDYRWGEGMHLDDAPEDLPEPPAWLQAKLDAEETESIPLSESDTFEKGSRNDTLTRYAGHMRQVGMSRDEINAALQTINQNRCDPPLSEKEVGKIAKSVERYEPDQISVAMVEDHFGQMAGSREPVSEIEDPGTLPESLLRVPGLISEVMDISLSTAPYPNQAIAFCGALTLMAFLAGRKVRDVGDNRTNIYVLGLAHSASGKDWPRKVNTKILHQIGLDNCLGDRFASGEGIQDAMVVTPSMIFQSDEIDGMLQSISKAKDARNESIMGTLLTLYSSANNIFPMRRKAGSEAAGTIDQPNLVLFGTAIPNHYYAALNERMLTNGFFARMLIVESAMRSEGQEPGIIEISDRVKNMAEWWADFQPSGGKLLNRISPIPRIVEATEAARELLNETRQRADFEYRTAEAASDVVGTTVWGRVGEQVRKLALIHAVSECHIAPKISPHGVRWASEFVIHQTRRMLYMASCKVAETEYEMTLMKAVNHLREAEDHELSHSKLLRLMRMDAKVFGGVITTLQQRGDVEIISNKTGGRPSKSYRLFHG